MHPEVSLFAIALMLACRSEPKPDVVLIVVDTLRYDALSMNGAPWESSPNLDAFADSALVFDRGYASSSWTLASTASLLTGRHPVNHGVVNPGARLNPEALTLTEFLVAEGYSASAFLSNPLVGGASEMLEGFDRVERRIDRQGSTSAELTELALGALDPERPDFLFLHYMDPHYPFLNHLQWDHAPAEGVEGLRGGEEIGPLREAELSPAQVDFLRACYLEEVRATDRAIGELLAGLGPDALVLVTSDHGEEFLERGWLGHVRHVHEELVHVPMMLAGPGIEAGRVGAPTSNGGFYATVAERLELRVPAEVQLPSLLGAPPAGVLVEVDYDPQALSYEAKRAHQRAWISADQKLLHDLDREEFRLYDLAEDPGERSGELLTEHPLVELLGREHARAGEGALERDWRTMDEKAREMLEALGYLD